MHACICMCVLVNFFETLRIRCWSLCSANRSEPHPHHCRKEDMKVEPERWRGQEALTSASTDMNIARLPGLYLVSNVSSIVRGAMGDHGFSILKVCWGWQRELMPPSAEKTHTGKTIPPIPSCPPFSPLRKVLTVHPFTYHFMAVSTERVERVEKC